MIGRFSTFLEHVKPLASGERVTKFNALFHWAVPPGREIEAGREVGRFHIMTHAYWREGGPEFNNVNVMGVAHGTEKETVLAHKRAIDEHLQSIGIPISYTNVFWGGRSEIKPSEISPFAYEEFCRSQGIDPESMRVAMLEAIDHINIVVRDLEPMAEFYSRVLGMRITKRVTISGDWIDRVIGLRNAVGEVIYLELPAGPRLELIRYVRPQGADPAGLEIPNMRGLRHIAFRVNDIDAAIVRLRESGIRTTSDAQTVPNEQVTYAGGVRKRLVYFQDPEKNILELCEYRADSGAPCAVSR